MKRKLTPLLLVLGHLVLIHAWPKLATSAEENPARDRNACLYQLINSPRVLTPDDRGLVRSTDQDGMTNFFIELALSLKKAKPGHELSKGTLDALRELTENEFVEQEKLERYLIYLAELAVSVDGLSTPILGTESIQQVLSILDLLGKKLSQPPADSDVILMDDPFDQKDFSGEAPSLPSVSSYLWSPNVDDDPSQRFETTFPYLAADAPPGLRSTLLKTHRTLPGIGVILTNIGNLQFFADPAKVHSAIFVWMDRHVWSRSSEYSEDRKTSIINNLIDEELYGLAAATYSYFEVDCKDGFTPPENFEKLLNALFDKYYHAVIQSSWDKFKGSVPAIILMEIQLFLRAFECGWFKINGGLALALQSFLDQLERRECVPLEPKDQALVLAQLSRLLFP